MPAMTPSPQQDELLRLLDTRMACLLVDRPATELLRRQLFALRDRLARERLDRATLREVDTAVRALAPRQTIDGEPLGPTPAVRPKDARQARPARPPARLGRALSGVAGLSGLALLVMQMTA